MASEKQTLVAYGMPAHLLSFAYHPALRQVIEQHPKKMTKVINYAIHTLTADRTEFAKLRLPTWPKNDSLDQTEGLLQLQLAWKATLPDGFLSFLPDSSRISIVSVIFHMVVAIKYRFNNLLETYAANSKPQKWIQPKNRETRKSENTVEVQDFVSSPAIVLSDPDKSLRQFLKQTSAKDDFPEIKAYLEREGIDKVSELITTAFTPGYKKFLAHNCRSGDVYNVQS